MSFLQPKLPKIKGLPSPPSRAISSVLTSGLPDNIGGLASLITTGSRGLSRKANTKKKALIGS